MPSPCKADTTLRRLRPALGCLVRIEASGLAEAELGAAIDAAYARVETIEQALSFHRPHSELHELHREATGAPHRVGTDLWAVLIASQRFWRASNGVFDPSVARALVRDGLLPKPDDLIDADARADFSAVGLLADQHIRLKQTVWLDFGGIAKGYAVDQALAVLRAAGASDACVNAGGDLACFGAEQTVALRDPRAPTEAAQIVRVHNAACATSGSYFQPRALRDGNGDRPQREHGSVSVIATDCMTADALTKIVWAAPQIATALLERYAARVIDLKTDDALAMESALAEPYDARP